MSKFFLGFLCALLAASCDLPRRPIYTDTKEEKISGRDGASLYQADVPSAWKRVDPKDHSILTDTTKAICEFYIEDPSGTIRITIHNFPSPSIDQRIPPRAQIQRWKSQVQGPSSELATAHDGFTGFFFQGNGTVDGQQAMVLGWAMQLAPEHYQAISSLQPPHYLQMRADYTIKAVGPASLMNRYQKSINTFADSFRLIREIPSPS